MKILIISVGGSPEPIIHSINEVKPDKVIAFCSAESRKSFVENVLPKTEFPAIDKETILVPDIQDLVSCVMALHAGVPEKLKLFKAGYEDLVVDYTGGTKTMSVAMAMALCDKVGTFVYIGGEKRTKDGLGTVESGTERILHQKNPWDELAVETLKDMAVLFNRCRFLSAKDMAKIAAGRSPSKKPLFQALEDVCDAFCKWDNFLYQPAYNMMKQASGKLRTICSASPDPKLVAFMESVSDSLQVLEAVCADMKAFARDLDPGGAGDGVDGSAIIKDLVANAIRRAEIEHKHDDAVARLYSAIEKHAKLRLKVAHGIDNSNVDLALVKDQSIRDMLDRECSCVRNGQKVIQVPLHKSYELLMALDDEVGMAYGDRSDDLSKVLTIRNMSLLAHGFAPVTDGTYKGMLDIALAFLRIGKAELPAFARMGWEDTRL